MGIIHVLDFETANLIAAGEVVDRPSSVMKELLENAVDAGARHITAEISRGGVASLRVMDDGSGMTAEDMPVALRRHATSKIKTGADLAAITTLGFRGEALAAIASVSKLSILSRPHGAPMGTLLEAEGGKITAVTEVGCAEGTTVSVEELFFNVPARRKFLKKDQTETLAVLAIAEKLALSRPDIALTFIADGNMRFSTAGDGDLKNALYAVLGREFAQKLLPVSGGNNGVTLSGYIGRSDNTRNNRNYQNVFINGRYVKSRTVMAALEQAYTSYIAPEKFPVCALFLELNPETVDVNVHPAKLEVKFTDERTVFEAVYYAVRAALENAAFRPEIALDKTKPASVLQRFIPIGDQKAEQIQMGADIFKRQTPDSPFKSPLAEKSYSAAQRPAISVPPPLRAEAAKPRKPLPQDSVLTPEESREILALYKSSEKQAVSLDGLTPLSVAQEFGKTDAASPSMAANFGKADAALAASDTFPLDESKMAAEKPPQAPQADGTTLPPYRLIGEAFHCYVMVETEDKLLLIDQHAAHERILFEELLREQREAGILPSQTLLLPLTPALSPEELAAAGEYTEYLLKTGFAYTLDTKKGCCEITAIPSAISTEDAEKLFTEMCDDLYRGQGDPALTEATRREKSLYQIACKAAIKGGRVYDEAQLRWLVEKLLLLPDITVCPHGRPVAVTLTKRELDRQFERIK